MIKYPQMNHKIFRSHFRILAALTLITCLGAVASAAAYVPPPNAHRVALACPDFPVNFSLLAHDDHFYIAFYDENHRLTVGSRRIDETKWTFA